MEIRSTADSEVVLPESARRSEEKTMIVRYKNKFEPKSTDTFKNIMVNALVRGVTFVIVSTISVCRFRPSKDGDQLPAH